VQDRIHVKCSRNMQELDSQQMGGQQQTTAAAVADDDDEEEHTNILLSLMHLRLLLIPFKSDVKL